MTVPIRRFLDNLHCHQLNVLKALDGGRSRFFILVWHRRARKTTLGINLLIRECVRQPKSVYLYVGPTYKQAKSIIWRDPNMLFSYLPDPAAMRWEKNESELFIHFANGSILQIKGGDDPDSLRGIDCKGVFFDEWALMKEEIWTEIFRPIIAQDPQRWAMFAFTPKGQNHASRMWQNARQWDGWYCDLLKASHSGLISASELTKARQEMPRSLYDQEFECSFVTDEKRTLITSRMIDDLRQVNLWRTETRRIVACDPATGGDECVIKVFENEREIDQVILHENNTMIIAGHLKNIGLRHRTEDYIVDEIGIGKGIVDDLYQNHKQVQSFNSACKATDCHRFANLRAEAWWYVAERIQAHEVDYIEDEETRRQLSSVRYRVVNSTGKILLDPKSDTRKLLGHSPDRADAYVMGIYGLQFVQPQHRRRPWHRERLRYKRRSWMAA